MYISPPPRNPLTRLLGAVLGAVALVGALMLGFVAFLVLGAVALVAGVVFWFRTRHIRRQMREQVQAHTQPKASGEVLDAEYTVVSREKDS